MYHALARVEHEAKARAYATKGNRDKAESHRRRAEYHASFGGGGRTYTLGPSDRRPDVEGDIQPVLVLDAHSARRNEELGIILHRMHAQEWTGHRPMRPENAWRHVPVGVARTGVAADVYIESEVHDESSKATAVIVKTGRGVPTALVLVEHDVTSFRAPQMARMGLAVAWKPHVSYIALLTTSDDTPRGHASLAMRNALLDARMHDKSIVSLKAIDGALLYYLRTRFDEHVHAFMCDSEEIFERSRAFALLSPTSGRGGRDGAMLEALMLESKNQVLFSLRGRSFLEGLDYETLSSGAPSRAEAMFSGTHVRMWHVAVERPLVVGYSYDVALASESAEPDRETKAGYVDVGNELLWGRRRFVGEFVGIYVGARRVALAALAKYELAVEHGLERWEQGIAVFENGIMGESVGLSYDARLVFRRTARAHDALEPQQDYRLCSIDELPAA